MSSELWKLTNYKAPYPYLVNQYITEYDIRKSNINVLLYLGLITEEVYNMLLTADRDYRQKYIGLLELKDKSIYDKLSAGVANFRKQLFDSNGILDNDILTIKNDAVFVINKSCNITKFSNVEFIEKNKYMIYMSVAGFEIYYYYSSITDTEIIDVKGISDEFLEKHRNGMIVLLCDICKSLINQSIGDAISIFSAFYDCFIKHEVAKDYYREFNSYSMYKILSPVSAYYLDDIDDSSIKSIDMTSNILFLRELYGVISDIYINSR